MTTLRDTSWLHAWTRRAFPLLSAVAVCMCFFSHSFAASSIIGPAISESQTSITPAATISPEASGTASETHYITGHPLPDPGDETSPHHILSNSASLDFLTRLIQVQQKQDSAESNYPEALMFPSHAVFSDPALILNSGSEEAAKPSGDIIGAQTGKAGSAAKTAPPASGSVTISVRASVKTSAPAGAGITGMTAGYSSDDGVTWKSIRLKPSGESAGDLWSAEIAPASAAAIPAGSTVSVVFTAMDTLGNITAELFDQPRPSATNTIDFSLLFGEAPIEEPPASTVHVPNPERAIRFEAASTEGYLFLKMDDARLSGITQKGSATRYTLRVSSIDAPAFSTMIGQGLYNNFAPESGLRSYSFPTLLSDEVFFYLTYDTFAMLQYAKYLKMLDTKPLTADQKKIVTAFSGRSIGTDPDKNILPPYNTVVSEIPLQMLMSNSSLYWRFPRADIAKQLAARAKSSASAEGFYLRLFTSHTASSSSFSSATRDFRTPYIAVKFTSRALAVTQPAPPPAKKPGEAVISK